MNSGEVPRVVAGRCFGEYLLKVPVTRIFRHKRILISLFHIQMPIRIEPGSM